jgi:hypothetical protein
VIASVYVVGLLKTPFRNMFVYLVIISSIIIFGLRCVAVKKYLPFLLGRETQNVFLTRHASRLPETFIDSDDFVKNNVPQDSRILIDRLHNLYYFPYNFDHTSWVKSREGYDYLITVDTEPSEINGTLLHTNEVGIQIYKTSK